MASAPAPSRKRSLSQGRPISVANSHCVRGYLGHDRILAGGVVEAEDQTEVEHDQGLEPRLETPVDVEGDPSEHIHR